jgi:hypothetical protein
MGRVALGLVSVRFRAIGAALFCGSAALAQVPAPPAAEPAAPPVAPPPAVSPGARPAVPRPAPPPLDLPSGQAPPSPPSFLQPREPVGLPAKETPEEFLLRASPWIDFTLTSFWQEQRFSNFLNLGVQVGGYFFERLRLSARLIAPLESVTDGYSSYQYGIPQAQSNGGTVHHNSRSMSVLYSASAGLVISNSRSFVFGPSIVFQRADVPAYGSAVELALPFEWTTRKNLRVGFELALGHAFGGNTTAQCFTLASPSVSCGTKHFDRPSGMALLLQYSMGWGLGGL